MKYRCEICNRTFKTSQALASHKRNKHRELMESQGSEVSEISKWIKSVEYWIKELDARISSIEEYLKLLGERIDKASFLIRCTFGNEEKPIYCPNCRKLAFLELRKVNGKDRWVCSVCGEIPF